MGTNPADELQKLFKTLSDPTRMRILRLLEREELMVQELMEVLGMAQSRVSRHLAILREAGLLTDRRDGTYVFYRFVPPAEGAWRDGWALVEQSLAGDPSAERDDALLRRVIETRGASSRSFFDAVGPEWDALRKVFNDDTLRARAIDRLVPAGLRVADVGTGTGILASELAYLGVDVVGIDSSVAMLEAARAKLADLEARSGVQAGRVEFRQGEATAMPIADDEMDAAFAHMVLHYIAEPAAVVREMARIVKPGGRLVVVDFVSHNIAWMRQELGVVWMGFDLAEVEQWFVAAGLEAVQIERNESLGRDRALPATFIASARRRIDA